MLVLTDTDPAISSEDFLQFEEILGKKLPEAMKDFFSSTTVASPKYGVFTITVISFLSIPLIHWRR